MAKNSKYAKLAQAFLDKHPGMTIDDALDYFEKLEEREE